MASWFRKGLVWRVGKEDGVVWIASPSSTNSDSWLSDRVAAWPAVVVLMESLDWLLNKEGQPHRDNRPDEADVVARVESRGERRAADAGAACAGWGALM